MGYTVDAIYKNIEKNIGYCKASYDSGENVTIVLEYNKTYHYPSLFYWSYPYEPGVAGNETPSMRIIAFKKQ